MEHFLEMDIVGWGVRPTGGIWLKLALHYNGSCVSFLIWRGDEDEGARMTKVMGSIALLKELTAAHRAIKLGIVLALPAATSGQGEMEQSEED